MAQDSVPRGSSNYKDLAGLRFGRLTVLKDVGRSASGKVRWRVRCDCGVEKSVVTGDMTSGRTRSCGCQRGEATAKRNRTHGMTSSPEYRAWASMIARCRYPSATGYADYGGRGIRVCDRWATSFEAFYADVGARPSPKHSLDRYPDVNGHYEPGNVRWATRTDQERNKRGSVRITIGGETRPILEWCELRGLAHTTVRDRIGRLGWTPEEALGFRDRSGSS